MLCLQKQEKSQIYKEVYNIWKAGNSVFCQDKYKHTPTKTYEFEYNSENRNILSLEESSLNDFPDTLTKVEQYKFKKTPKFFQFSSVTHSCPTLCDPMNHSTPGFPVHHQLLEFTQTHVHWVGDAIQPSRPLSSPSPPAPNPSQHQGLFQWVNSLHEVAKVLEFQLQHQSFQWTPRTDLF